MVDLPVGLPSWITVVHRATADLQTAGSGVLRAAARARARTVSGDVWAARRRGEPPAPPLPARLGIAAPPAPAARAPGAVDPRPGPARPRRYSTLVELIVRRAPNDQAPTAPILAPRDALRAAQLLLGRLRASLPYHRQRELAQSIEARARVEVDRVAAGRPLARCAWHMYMAIWALQYVEPLRLEADHRRQLFDELGITETALRRNPFAQWTAPSPGLAFHVTGMASGPGS